MLFRYIGDFYISYGNWVNTCNVRFIKKIEFVYK